jgi:5-methylcytosine-specific restriction endonuclease McrA
MIETFQCYKCGRSFDADARGQKRRRCAECKRRDKAARMSEWVKKNPERHKKNCQNTNSRERAAHAATPCELCGGPVGFGRVKHCPDCAKKMRLARSRDWMARNRERMREHARKRLALKKGAPVVEEFTYEQVYERDGTHCQICGAPVVIGWDRFVLGYNPLAAHVDHIVPLSRGGSHTLENVQLACAFCNQSKKDRLAA